MQRLCQPRHSLSCRVLWLLVHPKFALRALNVGIPTLACRDYLSASFRCFDLQYSRTLIVTLLQVHNQLIVQVTYKRTQCCCCACCTCQRDVPKTNSRLERFWADQAGQLYICSRCIVDPSWSQRPASCFRFCLGDVQIAARCTAMYSSDVSTRENERLVGLDSVCEEKR